MALNRRVSLQILAGVAAALLAPPASAATIHVPSPAQKVTGTGGCSLQEAIHSANFDDNIAIDTADPDHFIDTQCKPGSGDDGARGNGGTNGYSAPASSTTARS